MVLGREKSRGSAGSIPVEKAAEIPVGVVGLGLMGNSIWGEPAHVLRFMDLTGVPAYGRVRTPAATASARNTWGDAPRDTVPW